MTRSEKFHLIAGFLGGTARPNDAERPDGYWHITLADGVKLCASGFDRYTLAGRIEFSGSYPSYVKPEGGRTIVTPGDIYENGARLSSPSITVADSKTPEQIAKDVERRLLGTLRLREIWHKCKARCEHYTVQQDITRATVGRVAAATGGKPNVRDSFARIEWGYEIGHADYRGGYADEPEHFKVELDNVTEAKLVEIIKVLRG